MIDLSTYSAEALVDAVIRLTHRIESCGHDAVKACDYRAQRDLARAELIRRCAA